MSDILGWRGLFGILGPSTNTVVQPEFDDMRPDGVTNHYSRILTPNADAVSNESFMNATLVIANNVLEAVDSVMTCSPSYLVMGMSAITFYGGSKGADDFQRQVEKRSNLSVSIGSHATASALKMFSGVKRIGFVSPYFPAANQQVRHYFEEMGFDVITDICLECPSWTQIAQVPKNIIHQKMHEINDKGVDALVQVVTNLPMAHLVEEFEAEFEKPVVAINTATYWHALRNNTINDQLEGFGSLMSQY